MENNKFKKKYKGIKLYKFVHLLEKELKKKFREKEDWIETALDLKEEIYNIKNMSSLMELLVALICVNGFYLLYYLFGGLI